MKNLNELIDTVKSRKKVTLSVAAAHDEEVLLAIKGAIDNEIVDPILVGDENKIKDIAKEIDLNLEGIKIINETDLEKCAKYAVCEVSSNRADFVMKGLLDTSIILKAVLNSEWGLRTSNLLSHVMIYEVPNYHKLIISTDGGMNIAPNLEQKKQILENAIKATKPLGYETIKVACIAAKEKVSSKMQATVDAKALEDVCKQGEFGDNVIVEGPLAIDLALSKKSCEIKGFDTKVGGDVDILLMPTIEVGNAVGKTMTYMADAKSAGIIMGAKTPVVLVSRADTYESKLYSIAYGALIAGNKSIN